MSGSGGEGHRQHPGPAGGKARQQRLCCMGTRAPASPAPSRPSPTPSRTGAAGRGGHKKPPLSRTPHQTKPLTPIRFILFIDDLSFTANDDNFAALKAILEGSVGGRAGNIAVYATSNRRHLIKETLTDREGDDIHESDTRQELMSLSARFGLTITFGSPDRERYLHIVEELAKQYGVELDPRQLAVRSEAFAVRSGGRSARVAKQFIELCKAGVFS